MQKRRSQSPPQREDPSGPRAGGPRDDDSRPVDTRLAVWIALAIAVITTAVFWPVLGFEFVLWDDPWYVTANRHVTGGLSWSAVAWAFTSSGDFYWHPLTWMSHMLDVTLYGLNASGHHATSLALHVATTLLLFVVLRSMTGATWRSAFVSALFGVHPLRVESVAWVAERKDVLSACLWMLTLAAYRLYAKRPGWRRYLGVAAAFGLGLMAKPMIVTLPVGLLLLDVWPLRRWPGAAGPAPLERGSRPAGRARAIGLLVAEKLPLLAMALAAAIVTIVMQQDAGAIGSLSQLPMYHRVSNAAVSYAAYIRTTLVPMNLAAFYPYPAEPPAPWLVALAAAGIIVALVAALKVIRTRPYVFVGLAWYLVTLLPVVGLVQAGDQLRADRFTYLPLVGIFIAAAWGAHDVARSWPAAGRVMAGAGAVVVLACAAAAHAQVRYWSDTEALWTRALSVTAGNHRAHAGMGDWLSGKGRLEEAERHYREAVRLAPAGADYRQALGRHLMRQGRLEEAVVELARAVELNPRSAAARVDFGAALARQGRVADALQQYSEALRLDPGNALGHNNLGLALLSLGRLDDSLQACREAARLDPQSADARQCAGLALARLGNHREAAGEFAEAVRLDPGSDSALVNLGVALSRTSRTQEARDAFERALRINPASETARAAIAELNRSGR